MVAGGLRLAVIVLAERLHDLVVDVVDDVAANRRHALGGVNVDVHRPFGMRARRLAEDAGHQFDRAADLEVEKAQRILGVQAVDQMLDVGRGILRMLRPETEYSSSLRLTTTVEFIGKRSSLPA